MPTPPPLELAPEDIAWLLGPQAARWLALLAPLDFHAPATLGRLRRDLSPIHTALLLQVLVARNAAKAKFEHADHLFFTRLGLEQATDLWIARYKARRFPEGMAVADLCCGCGGDLLALSERGPVVGVDRSPTAAALAGANLGAWTHLQPPRPEDASTVVCGDVTAFDLSAFAAWHIDPDRRPTGRRTTQTALHEPDDASMDRLLAANPNAAVKLAPAATLPGHWHERAELEWISRDRECRQLVAWFGQLAVSPGARRATQLCRARSPRGGDERTDTHSPYITTTFTGRPSLRLPPIETLGRYVFDPDPAVLAADLTGALATALDLGAVNPAIAYLTADRLVDHPLLAAFEVEAIWTLDRKRLRRMLRERDIGRLEIKKRGVPIEPEALRSELKPRGENSATLLLFPWKDRVVTVLAHRVDRTGDPTSLDDGDGANR